MSDHEGQFQRDLASLLNSYSAESPSGTPDFILSDLLTNVLREFNEAVGRRAEWRGEQVEFAPKSESQAESAAYDILKNQGEARERLVQLLMKDPGMLATFGNDWEMQMGDISFHTDPESMRQLDVFKISVVQDVYFRARPDERIVQKEVEEVRPSVPVEGIFSNLEDARIFENELRRTLSQHGVVSRSDYLSLLGSSPNYQDSLWGWKNLEDLRVVRRINQWVVKLPPETRVR